MVLKIKICGVTSVEDALAAAEAEADFVGVNFYNGSPRCVQIEQAARIVRQLPATVEAVGLFVNASAAHIRDVASAVGLKTLQLHGDEPPESLRELDKFRLIRAYRLPSSEPFARGSESGLAPLQGYLDQCCQVGRLPNVVLVDAHVAGRFGGTGRSPPWESLAAHYPRDHWPPLLLAGGLTPENVAEAVRLVRPWGVDTASGVESVPGRKDRAKVRAFIRAARQAALEPLES